MSRYKGRASVTSVERDFPHVVEMQVPANGFGKKLDAMYDFHTRHGIRAQRGRGRRDASGRDYVTWCFADPAIAAEFANEFGTQWPPDNIV
jgi:hypothetical protein